jgi:splicing factor U2AF subunit
MEITSALLEFDGVDVLGRGKVKIKRPNDYNPALAPILSMETMPMFDTSKLGIVSQTVQDGPNKIFIGGLPYHLVESQVLELLSAFGAVKAFHLVKNDPTSVTSKGYCFVEYVDPNVTQIAAIGLNGMDMGGGKVLTAKVADQQGVGTGGTAGGSVPMAAPTNVVDGVDVDALLNAAIGGAGAAPMPDMMMQQQYHLPLLAAGLDNAMSQQPQVVVTDPLAVANAAASALDAAFGGGAGAAQPVAQAFASSSPTRILVLLNMVSDDDLRTDEDRKFLEEEVSEEAGKYGRLLSMKIPRHGVSLQGIHFRRLIVSLHLKFCFALFVALRRMDMHLQQ